MSKSVLLLQLLDLLKTDPSMNALDLANALGRSERTVYRYLQALAVDLEVPVYYDGGYKIAGRPRLAPINFTQEEAIALRLALSAAPIRRTEPLNTHAASALRRIEAAMSENALKQTLSAGGKMAIGNQPHEVISQKSSLLPMIEEAVYNQQTLRIQYRSLQSSKPGTRDYDPYALVFRKHNWYLVGYCHRRKRIIQLKVARVDYASLLPRRFDIPDEFSIDSFYEGSWEVLTGDPIRVEVLFDKSVARLITEGLRHPTQETEKRPDGSVVFKAKVAGYHEIGWWVLSFGGCAEALAPPEFREWMAEHARQMAARYR